MKIIHGYICKDNNIYLFVVFFDSVLYFMMHFAELMMPTL